MDQTYICMKNSSSILGTAPDRPLTAQGAPIE